MATRGIPAVRPTLARLLALALAAPLLAGCATFKSSKRLDVGPFAENTVGMIGEVQRVTKPVVWTYLKKYESLPSVSDVRRTFSPARTLMRGVALYSTQIVSIYESDMPESRKSQGLAYYLDTSIRERLRDNPTAQVFLSQGRLDSAVTNCRNASSFLAALGAAQPVVSAALTYGNAIYDSLEVRIDIAAADVGTRIETEFAPLKMRLDELTNLQLIETRSYTLLSEYRGGNDAALDSLRLLDPETAETLPAGRKPATSALDATERRILNRIETTSSVRRQLDQRFEEYRAQQQELDWLRIQAREGTRLGRITLILWARSHRNLAAGVKVPAAINVMGIVGGAAGKAAGVVVP